MIPRKNAIEPKQITQRLLDVTKFMPEKLISPMLENFQHYHLFLWA